MKPFHYGLLRIAARSAAMPRNDTEKGAGEPESEEGVIASTPRKVEIRYGRGEGGVYAGGSVYHALRARNDDLKEMTAETVVYLCEQRLCSFLLFHLLFVCILLSPIFLTSTINKLHQSIR